MSAGSHGKKKPLIQPQHDDSHGGGDDHGEGNWLVSYADMMTLLVGFFVILLSFANVDETKYEKAKESISKEFGGIYQMPYNEIVDAIRKKLEDSGAGGQFTISSTQSGIEISFLGTVFFVSGSADVKPEGKMLLDKVLPTIKKESVDFDVVIEGHTDDVPLAGGGVYKNNFELSSIRACRVLDFFMEMGFSKTHLTAVGFGETRPLVPNRDEDGEALIENQSQNRRVVIRLTKKSSSSL
jgi:chemotaxis protein MotB